MVFSDPAPYLLTLGFDRSSFDRLESLRARYFPPDRNLVPAHLSLFHQLPGDEADEIRDSLEEIARSTSCLPLVFGSLKKTGRGMMVVVEAPGLASVRARLARSFGRWLTPQDRQPFHPHVMIMNKAEPTAAARAFDQLRGEWVPFSGSGQSLLLWLYRGGPWEAVESFDFRRVADPTGPGVGPS